jgi:hypothetical protein
MNNASPIVSRPDVGEGTGTQGELLPAAIAWVM